MKTLLVLTNLLLAMTAMAGVRAGGRHGGSDTQLFWFIVCVIALLMFIGYFKQIIVGFKRLLNH